MQQSLSGLARMKYMLQTRAMSLGQSQVIPSVFVVSVL